MSWSSPRTWVVAEVVTAALLNTHVRDNLDYLKGNAGAIFLNDTSNANMTNGVTINQGAADDEILALKSSDVAHGVTTIAETDTYGRFVKYSGTNGGLTVTGFTDTATVGVNLQAVYPTDNTTKSTAGIAPILLNVYRANGTGTQDAGADANLLAIANRGTTRFLFDAEGTLHPIIGDADIDIIRLSGTTGTPALAWNETRDRFTFSKGLELPASLLLLGATANAQMTSGITIAQGAADDEILTFKSSDVAHGMTALTETDTFAYFGKASGTGGGLQIRAFTDGDSATPFYLVAVAGGVPDTTKSTAGLGVINLNARVQSGTGSAATAANSNLVAIANYNDTRFILDADGDSHQDVGTAWTNFDDYDDPGLLTALSVGVSRQEDPIRERFGHFLHDYRPQLERARLVTFNDDGHHFVNMSRLAMLLVGAVRQLDNRLQAAEGRLALEGGV